MYAACTLPTAHAKCLAGCYGSTKRYKSFDRLRRVNDCTVIGASGELSDFQYILNLLDELCTEDYCMDDGTSVTAKEIFTYLTEVLYNRRNKCAPDSSPHEQHWPQAPGSEERCLIHAAWLEGCFLPRACLHMSIAALATGTWHQELGIVHSLGCPGCMPKSNQHDHMLRARLQIQQGSLPGLAANSSPNHHSCNAGWTPCGTRWSLEACRTASPSWARWA